MQPNSSPLLIPKALIGRHRTVTGWCRRAARTAIRTGSWDSAFSDSDWVHVDGLPGSFVLLGPSTILEKSPVLLYALRDAIAYATKSDDRTKWYLAQRDLLLMG